jgi:hypothetical protein
MSSMHAKIPRVKKSGHLLPVLPLIPQKTTKMKEENGKFIAYDLKTRVEQPSGARMNRHAERLGRDLDPEFHDRWH